MENYLADIERLVTITAIITNLIFTFRSIHISNRNAQAIEQVHKATNSMKDELVSEVKTAYFAAGQLDANRQTKEKAKNS